ncbi:ABC-F family ATP-binding cassette domain-containing protein [bacterium]|nr:MAG: ABC-F family ATP-binding cassette domain-containing protein [bacterium]
MLVIQNLSYAHPNKDVLFRQLFLSISAGEKTAIIGSNGTGKSTLFKLISGELQPQTGHIHCTSKPYVVPQHFGQFDTLTIAEALCVHHKIQAIQEIESGIVTEENLQIIHDDWLIEDKLNQALRFWGERDLHPNRKLSELSGGQKTKVFLAGLLVHDSDLVLLDEPSNHLDLDSRNTLYQWIEQTKASVLLISHDIELLNRMDSINELQPNGMVRYGGNYEFYYQQKQTESAALENDLKHATKALKKAKQVEREAFERKQKMDSRGRKKQEKAGMPLVMLHKMQNDAENSAARLKNSHAEKVADLSTDLSNLKERIPDLDKIRFGLGKSDLYAGKMLFSGTDLKLTFGESVIWKDAKSFELMSGERIAIKGKNGSGKSSLVKMIVGKLSPTEGSVKRADFSTAYIDQDYSIISNSKTVLEQAREFAHSEVKDHEIKTRLSQFLFRENTWEKSCEVLSGGEKMRLTLCCLSLQDQAPDCLILDEPTNNLDIPNVEVLTRVIQNYEGTLLVISHDLHFLNALKVQKEWVLT